MVFSKMESEIGIDHLLGLIGVAFIVCFIGCWWQCEYAMHLRCINWHSISFEDEHLVVDDLFPPASDESPVLHALVQLHLVELADDLHLEPSIELEESRIADLAGNHHSCEVSVLHAE